MTTAQQHPKEMYVRNTRFCESCDSPEDQCECDDDGGLIAEVIQLGVALKRLDRQPTHVLPARTVYDASELTTRLIVNKLTAIFPWLEDDSLEANGAETVEALKDFYDALRGSQCSVAASG